MWAPLSIMRDINGGFSSTVKLRDLTNVGRLLISRTTIMSQEEQGSFSSVHLFENHDKEKITL
jgi:hypothetical protein